MIDYDKFEPIILDGETTEYIMNRNGVIKNIKTGYILNPYITKKGRARYTIKHKNKCITCTRARWLAIVFIPTPDGYNIKDLEADHVDGDKTNDNLSNIQWLTPDGNKKKSYTIDGNLFYGELNSSSKLKEKIVRQILSDLSNGYTPKELSKKYGIKSSAIVDIKIGRIWKHLSKDYDLEKFINRRHNIERYSDELKSRIRDILTTNINMKNKKVCKCLNLEYNNKTRCLINNIRNKMNDKSSTTNKNDEYYKFNKFIILKVKRITLILKIKKPAFVFQVNIYK